ncbi:hypothetical protein CULT_30029 [[Clostridium] ultunense Esp]|nr:hypothetical protein CULT_30029 [[Clostridium] ultunense Esp]
MVNKNQPDFDYGAKRDRFLWIGRDISRQASQEEFLEKSSHLALIQEFAAGVAHELRNPITTIRGFLTLLQQESKGISREGVSYFPMILAEIDKIEEVVNHFLLFAKSSRAKKEEVLLRSILEEVIRDAEQEGLIEKDGITALFDGENPIVMGNREMLKLSFKNLLRYILEGKDEGSPLTVKGERDEGNFYSIRFIYVDVRTKEIVEKAGLPHYSLNEKGIGIEMMISYKVIADHMGQIAIERDEGKTLLQVLLPYSRASSYETELEEQILGRSELTNREKEVLKLVCLGYKNKEISEQLMISEHTVKNHVSNILQKLELNDRSQLMVMFLHPQKGMKSST